MILKMKTPVKATLFMGIEKEYSKVAIRCDQPDIAKTKARARDDESIKT